MNPIILMLVFEIKHYLCDFLLQTDYHTGKFNKKGWVLPLAHHCAIHALATLLILICLGKGVEIVSKFWWLSLVDFGVHFVMDRIKASPNLLGRFKYLTGGQWWLCKHTFDSKKQHPPAIKQKLLHNKIFWWCLGLDQLVHQLTSLFIVWRLTVG